MFRIRITRSVCIVGCPRDGLAAVDFRRTHGLPEAPTDEIRLEIDVTDEATARAFGGFLDGHADVDWILGTWERKQAFNPRTYDATGPYAGPEESDKRNEGFYRLPVSPDLAARLLRSELPAVAELAAVYRADRARAQREYEEARSAHVAEKHRKEEELRRARELFAKELAELEQLRRSRRTLAEFLAEIPDDALRGTVKRLAHSPEAVLALRQKVEDASPVVIFEDDDEDGEDDSDAA